ncbi:hypothetical protein JW824_10870 [bacterium]|nr:hypothetical protein [bacterium]
MEKYPWYTIVKGEDPLRQGDFIDLCPVVIPSQSITQGVGVTADVIEYNVTIMSQSCDLENEKIDLVLVCPIWSLKEMEEKSNFLKSSEGKESLRRGNIPGYHLLNKCELDGHNSYFMVVDFRSVYSVPYQFLLGLAKKRTSRLRLLPPYREHLSQAFARFFMRVGLPVDIPRF